MLYSFFSVPTKLLERHFADGAVSSQFRLIIQSKTCFLLFNFEVALLSVNFVVRVTKVSASSDSFSLSIAGLRSWS